MTIWVKEIPEIITVDAVRIWLRDDIVIRPFCAGHNIGNEDIIIVSKNEDSCEQTQQCAMKLIFEETIEKIRKNVLQEINCNYDYYQLKAALDAAKQKDIDTLIAGSSYGLFGIDERQLTTAVNLSLTSQDLYYAVRGIYEVCAVNRNIRNIVLCYGYYSFYSDLSRTQNEGEIQRVSNVYYPIYGDMHNCTLLPPNRKVLCLSNIFDMERIAGLYFAGEYEKQYFNESRPRKKWTSRQWDNKSKDWNQLSELEKAQAGRKRAEDHNKTCKYENTLQENRKLFKQLSEFCSIHGINLMFVIAPATKYYRKYLYEGFKDASIGVLNEAKGDIHLLDLFEDPNFVDEDFNDMDHLGDMGAEKMTSVILNTLYQLNNYS